MHQNNRNTQRCNDKKGIDEKFDAFENQLRSIYMKVMNQ